MFPLMVSPGLDLSSTLDIGIGVGKLDGQPTPIHADPRKEYVATAGVIGDEGIYRGFDAIERGFGGPLAWHGIAEYERMYHTPIAGSCIDTIRYGVLANEINLLPAVVARLGRPIPGQKQGGVLEVALASEILESNKRLLAAWDTPVEEVLWEHMEDLYTGHVLSEVIADDVVGGPDDGLLAIRAVRPKHRSTYQFRVDRAFNVVAIKALAFDDENNVEMKVFDPDHFIWSTNDPHRNDPRGRSCYRKSHYHWRLLMDLWPEVWKGWRQFGVPMLWGNTAAGAKMVPTVGKDGKPTPGAAVTAEYAMAMTMGKMRGGDSAAGPEGSNIKVIESTKDASVASGGISVLEGQIIRATLLQLRATTEAKNGSRADSETGENIQGTVIRGQRQRRERFLRKLLMKQNVWNYGPDIARRLTPLVDLGGTEHQDFAANSAGVGLLFQSEYFTEEQLPYVDTFLGLPQRQIGDSRVGPASGATSELPADPAKKEAA